ncbi:MAG TPA: diguanylate cyclase [Chloroflexia bacterium]|nr:diguanylate cyclase [Chloroflexia bacterium]
MDTKPPTTPDLLHDRIHDPARLAALTRLALLEAPASPAFDRLTRLAARLLRAPAAVLSAIAADRQVVKSALGLPAPWTAQGEIPLTLSFCQYTLLTDQPFLVEDAAQHPWLRDNPAIRSLGIAAYAGVPLVTAAGHAVGVLCVIDFQLRAWTAADSADLQDLAALGRAEIERRDAGAGWNQAQELLLLDRVHTALARELDLQVVFRTVVAAIAETFGYSLVDLYLLQGDVLVLEQQVGYEAVIERIPVTQGVAGRVARTGQAELLPDVSADPAYLGLIPGIVSEICVPLFDEGRVAGILNVETTGDGPLTAADLRLMQAVGEQVSIAMERARLYTAMRASEARFRGLAEATFEGVALLQDGRIVAANAALARLFGYTSEEVLGRNALELAAPESRALIADHIRSGYAAPYEAIGLRKDGSTFAGELCGKTIPYQGGLVRVTAIRDITARKQDEQEHERLVGALRKALARTQALYQTARSLIIIESLDELLQAVVNGAAAALPADAVTVVTFDLAAQQVTHVVNGGPGSTLVYDVLFPELEEGLSGWVLRERQATRSPGGAPDPRESPVVQRRRAAMNCGAIMVAPLIYRDALLGTITASNRPDERDFTAEDLELLLALAHQAASAIANAQLFSQVQNLAMTDSLTGLYNRRGFLTLGLREVERARRAEQGLAVLVLDIDHFKQINDTYGHAVGDQVLCAIGDRCRASIREIDVLGRIGGEELAIVLPAASRLTAFTAAERLRRAIAETPLASSAGPIAATISIGVATAPAAPDLARLLDEADHALYRAKAAGRNCVAD